jgi:hypothetical protein
MLAHIRATNKLKSLKLKWGKDGPWPLPSAHTRARLFLLIFDLRENRTWGSGGRRSSFSVYFFAASFCGFVLAAAI